MWDVQIHQKIKFCLSVTKIPIRAPDLDILPRRRRRVIKWGFIFMGHMAPARLQVSHIFIQNLRFCVHCHCCKANFEMVSWRWDNLGFSRMCLIGIAFCASLFLLLFMCSPLLSQFQNQRDPIPQLVLSSQNSLVTLLVTANSMNGHMTNLIHDVHQI